MKQKLLFLLTALMLLTTGNAWGRDVPYTFGSFSDGYRGAYSDPYTVKNGETLHITFTNNNNGTDKVWNNYVIEATSAVDKHDAVYFDLRGDNYAFGAGTFVQNYNGNCTSDLNGATVDNYITYVGGVITVNQIFTKAEVTTYNRVYTYTVAGSPKSVIIYVTEEAAQVTITNVETSKWSTVWNTDFSSAPSGMTYSVTSGSCDIASGYISYHQGGGSGNRAINTAFTDAKFNVDTNWTMEFDWNCSSANTNASNVIFATNSGTAFSMEWANYASAVVVKDGGGTSICTTLPLLGYNIGTCTSWSHITINGVKDEGVYLTIAKGGVVYVNKQLVTSTFGYPATFNGSLGKAVSHMYVDNVSFKTPAASGFVATPTSEITGAVGTSRKFTLSCLTDGATIFYATSDLEKGAAGWNTYAGEVTTDATTIYAYAEDDDDNTSEKMNFATGAGTVIDLLPATVTHSNNGVYTIASNQSAILGAPTATIHYQIDGGSEQTSTNASVNVNIVTDGTLTYWLTAEGYGATDPADETVYAAVVYVVSRTIDFKTSNTNEFSKKGDEVTVTGDTHTYYLYKDQSDNLIAEDILATSFENGDASWRIQRYYGGTAPYSKTGYIALRNLAAGQIVQFLSYSAPSIVSNLTAVPASTYTGIYTYTATTAGDVIVSLAAGAVITEIKLCSPMSVTVTIGGEGYSTFGSQYPLDLENLPSGLEAFKATGVNGSNYVVFQGLNTAVAANTGLLLKGTADTEYDIPVAASGETVTGNLLFVNADGTTFTPDDGYNYYGLVKDSKTFASFAPKTVAIPASKAYLKIAETSARTVLYIDEDDAPTAINAIEAADAKAEGLKDGKYLINGRIVMVNNGKAFGANGQILK